MHRPSLFGRDYRVRMQCLASGLDNPAQFPANLAWRAGAPSLQLKSPMAPPLRLLAAAAAFSPLSAWAAAAPPISYNDQIQPILAENCFLCHGPDSSTRKAKLRLDRAEFATKPRGDGDLEPAIVPGDPARSPLIERLKSKDPEEVMPPPEAHKTVSPEQVALLERWIAEGARYEEHWSFLPPRSAAVPASTPWVRNAVDAFIAQRLEREGLRPAAEEAPARLLRRAALEIGRASCRERVYHPV